MIAFEIDLKPIAASRPRVTRWSTYYKEPYNSYKELLKQKMELYTRGNKTPLFDDGVALELDVLFEMEIPKSFSKKKREALNGSYVTKKPDLDNLVKSIKDAMNGYIYKDDSQVVISSQKKIYSLEPKTIIIIKEVYEKDEK